MIQEMRIERLKCFIDQIIPLGNITVLTGNNGTGKSTVIQSLLLLRQADEGGSLSNRIPLNGHLVNIGTAADALFAGSQEDTISFSVVYSKWPDQTYSWIMQYDKEAPYQHFMNCSFITKIPPNLDPFIPRLTYLMAERLGPRLTYPMSDLPKEEMTVGSSGEFTAHCLAEFGQNPITNPKLVLPNEDGLVNLTLLNQTQLWMRKLIPGVVFNVESIVQADRVRLETRFYDETSKYLRPTNVGFGISYSLPIIVAALMAEEDGTLIIENPEAHLHPASQSQISQFLAKAASFGLQVIIETHSDHILNGIRIAVKENIIAEDKVSVSFFTRGVGFEGNNVNTLKIYKDGGINQWPDGFFDQLEQDLGKLI